MTNDEIDNLTGEALAAAVAVEVMAWHQCIDCWWDADEKIASGTAKFRPDRDWSAAGMVVEKMIATSDEFELDHSPRADGEKSWRASFTIYGKLAYCAFAPTAPTVICRAALKCVRAKK